MPESVGADLIRAERHRQLEKEGWSAEHDDSEHSCGELIEAAVAYAVYPGGVTVAADNKWHHGQPAWPWAAKWDKRRKHDRVKRLTIAGALLAAEIDREVRKEK